jgi:cell division protein FtsL
MTARPVTVLYPATPAPAQESTAAAPARNLRPWIIFTAAVVIAFFGLIYSRIALDQSAFVLDELQDRIASEEARYWDLRREVAELEVPERITVLAAEMGLEYPQQPRHLMVAGVRNPAGDVEQRWAELKALLSAQP